MSKHFSFRLCLLPFVVLAATTLLVATDALGEEAAQLDRYTHPDGTNYYSLSLKPTMTVKPAAGHDIVILVDTSASQMGKFREKQLDAVRAFLAELKPSDRVTILASDLDTSALVHAAAPGSQELATAVTKLQQRTPLGSSDLEKAIDTAVHAFDKNSKARSLVYIGDGGSAANLLGTEKFEQLVDALIDARVPVTSYGVGPKIDAQVIGSLAGRTGGVVVSDDAQAGRLLAKASQGVVYWPTSAAVPGSRFSEIYPSKVPPLRTDRDSVLVGTLKGEGPLDITMKTITSEGEREMAWKVTPSASKPKNEYLANLVGWARQVGGTALPIVDSSSLKVAQDIHKASAINLGELANQALAGHDTARAKALAEAALRYSPGDRRARAILVAADDKKVDAGLNAAGPNVVGETATNKDDLNMVAEEPKEVDGAFARGFQMEREVIAGQVQKSVQVTINHAQKKLGAVPEVAVQELKLEIENVRRVPDLDPDVRGQMLGKLESALRQANKRLYEVEIERQQQAARRAAEAERQIIAENVTRKREKVTQLMRRFESLLSEKRYREANYRQAEEQVATEAVEQAYESGSETAVPSIANAIAYSRMKRHYFDNQTMRIKRQKAIVDALASTEESFVSFDDREPILYPDAEAWMAMSDRRKQKYSSMDLFQRSPSEKKILQELEQPTEFDYIERPLSDVINDIKERHGIEISLDTAALETLGVAQDTPVSRQLKGIPLRSALRLMLHDLEMTYMIENDVLVLTSKEQADLNLSTRVYPVADLVIPVQNGGGMGGMGGMMGMGGMGMGMGMGGMGMGGMGMGGMGMGGMGMGGMGMGGGMFNVLPPQAVEKLPNNVRDILPKRNLPGGFQAFNMKDDLSRPVDEKKATDAKAAKSKTMDTIDLTITEKTDLSVAFDDYFKTHRPDESVLRGKIRQLMGEKKMGQIIALIQGAIKNGQAQPWMYEALALAMKLDGRDKKEIERVVMSAVDMADTPDDLMNIAFYLKDLDMPERALQVFEQVSKIVPDRPEPYTHGLELARELNNLEGIHWATVGILGRAWPEKQADVWIKGMRSAKATLEELKNTNQLEKAKAYEKSLEEALVRDVVICVSWTGDADVDLKVEEPTGTVCSSRIPRTSAGGIMLGDNFAKKQDANADAFSEYYVCPKGFAGDYKLLVERIWGEVTAGKVKVDVFVNWNTDKAQHIGKSITLKNDAAGIAFNLPEGRRIEKLDDVRVAQLAAEQLEIQEAAIVGQLALAQQLATAVDPQAMMNLANSRSTLANSTTDDSGNNTGNGNNGNNHPFLPFRQGAVGYQPVIQMLPEGAGCGFTAVVSADRRYVRITPQPQFSQISEVNTFNFASGESGTSNGGGNNGYSGGSGGYGGYSGGMGGMGGMSGGYGGMGGMGGMSGGYGGMSGGYGGGMGSGMGMF